jgi:hypothetical protein
MGQHGRGWARTASSPRRAGLLRRADPPTRRWPWALLAAVVGAAAGSAAALAVRFVEGEDAPDALHPDELQAVVDRPAAPHA